MEYREETLRRCTCYFSCQQRFTFCSRSKATNVCSPGSLDDLCNWQRVAARKRLGNRSWPKRTLLPSPGRSSDRRRRVTSGDTAARDSATNSYGNLRKVGVCGYVLQKPKVCYSKGVFPGLRVVPPKWDPEVGQAGGGLRECFGFLHVG